MKFVKSAVLAVAFLLIAQGAAQAQVSPTTIPDAARIAAAGQAKGTDTRGLGVGLVIIGVGLGIGGLTKSGVESMARQPELADKIQTAMIIFAALIEGVAFFALIILMLFTSPY